MRVTEIYYYYLQSVGPALVGRMTIMKMNWNEMNGCNIYLSLSIRILVGIDFIQLLYKGYVGDDLNCLCECGTLSRANIITLFSCHYCSYI